MSFHFSRLAFLALGCAALSSRPALAAPVWSDPLTGSQIDTVHWTTSAPNVAVTVAPSTMGLLETVAASAQDPIGVGLVSRCSLAGDFDVQVDYQLSPWPDHSGARIGLIMLPSTTASVADCAIERDSLSATGDVSVQMPGSEVYIGDVGPESQPFPDVPTTDTQGTIRLTRTGATETAYFAAAGGSWTAVFSRANTTEPVFGELGAWSAQSYRSTAGGGSSVYFRNYTVNSGQLNCPDAGAPDASGTPDASPRDAAADLGVGNIDGGGKTSSSGCGCNFGSDNPPATGGGLLSLVVLMLLALGLRRNPRAGT